MTPTLCDPDRSRIVETARAWLGTPYRHQASRRGVGCDCLGLLRGVWLEVYGVELERPPPYTPDWSEFNGRERLLEAGLRLLPRVPVPQARPADALLFRMRRGAAAKHLGLLSAPDRFLHAYSTLGVVESPFDPGWRRRVIAAFRLPPPS
ncbi:MAG: NlpC/P60 family protein [Pseudomonadota bacterium]